MKMWRRSRSFVLGPVVLLGAVGCKGKALDEGSPVFTVTPLSLDFGVVPLGSESTLDVTLTNTGGGVVELLSVTLTSGDTDVWTVDPSDVGSIDNLTPGVVHVTLEPEDEEGYAGQIQIRTDDATQESWLVSLTGAGGPTDEDYDQDGYSPAEGDCDDGNANVHPGAEEGCDGLDSDCNGAAGPGEVDADYDGSLVCEGDCDDNDGSRSPDYAEACDGGIDNDCDATTIEDVDGEGDGWTICDGDCDDSLPSVNPSRAEICDGVDNDCDSGVDNLDLDGDGHSLCSASGDCDDGDPYAYPVVASPYGSSYGDGTDLAPYDSLATALANLDVVCHQVVLEPGTYNDNAHTWTGGTVTISGRTGDPADVVLTAAPYSRLFDISGGAVTLEDVTLTGGDSVTDGGAIQVVGATLDLSQVILSGNSTEGNGGALSARNASVVTLRGGTSFDGNTALGNGGAIAVEGSTLDDLASSYTLNSAARGGAVDRINGTTSFDDSEFRSNSASEGGAMAAIGNGELDVERCLLVLNSASGDGGALWFRDLTNAGGDVRNNRIQDNTAQNGGAIAVLGALGTMTLANNTLTGNTASSEGAGLYVTVLGAPGIAIASNVLHSNDGLSAIYVTPGSGAQLIYNTAFLTNSGVHFAGEVGDGSGAPLDPTNFVRDPQLVAMSDDDFPDNDDLDLGASSPEIDAGLPFGTFDDVDGSTNDRGWTGGPGAP